MVQRSCKRSCSWHVRGCMWWKVCCLPDGACRPLWFVYRFGKVAVADPNAPTWDRPPPDRWRRPPLADACLQFGDSLQGPSAGCEARKIAGRLIQSEFT